MSILTTLIEGHYTLKCGDHDIEVKSHIDLGIQSAYTQWHYQREAKALAGLKDTYSVEEFDNERKSLRKAYKDGEFDFKSKRGAETLKTAAGINYVMSQLMGVPEADAIPLLVQCDQEELKELVNLILQDSFPEEFKAAKKKGAALQSALKSQPGKNSNTDGESNSTGSQSSSTSSTSVPGKSVV